MKNKLDFDASKLFEALKYQIHVAIEYCHGLSKSDVIWIEVFGDVTVEEKIQIEVKLYSDDLSDSHANLWNTINNWLKHEFQHQKYANLILLTTQAYSMRSSLKGWNEADVEERFYLLSEIYTSSVRRFEQKKEKDISCDDEFSGKHSADIDVQENSSNYISENKNRSHSPSESLKLQHKVMASENRTVLLDVLPKIKIITEQPGLVELLSSYKQRYLPNIGAQRQDDFINDLFGFMTSAGRVVGGWKITREDFEKKYSELTVRYVNGTFKFPRLNKVALKAEISIADVHRRLFARKLDEIGGDEELIREASSDLLHAEKYIIELVKDIATSQDDIQEYSDNQLRLHRSSRASAMYKCAKELTPDDLKIESCVFYNDRCATSVDGFSTYVSTPVEFRNGIYHMLADQETGNPLKDFHWRLWK